MLGLVFTELMQFIEERHGEATVDAVLDVLQLEHDGAYTAVGNYPHTEAVAFLSQVAEQQGEPLPEMIEAFGRHLFGRFHTLYPEFFEGIETSMDFMERVEDHIHTEVKKLYGEASPPRLATQRQDDGLRVSYRSHRPLATLALGLLHGCIETYGASDRVEQLDDGSDPHRAEFHVRSG